MTELEEQADLNESVGLQNLPQVWRVGAILNYFQRNQATTLSIRRDDKLQNFLHEMTISNNIGKLWDISKEVGIFSVLNDEKFDEKSLKIRRKFVVIVVDGAGAWRYTKWRYREQIMVLFTDLTVCLFHNFPQFFSQFLRNFMMPKLSIVVMTWKKCSEPPHHARF